MKARKFSLTLTILAILFAIQTSFAEKTEFIKEIHKEFKTSSNTLLDISNKYGDVTIIDWDKQEVKIDVKITVQAKDQEKADKTFARIDIAFNNSDVVIKAVTEIKNKVSFISTESNNVEFQIDYTVHMPINQKLDLSNKFGSIFINEIHGVSNITCKYGELQAKKLLFENTKVLSKVDLQFSDAKIGSCNFLKVVAKYSALDIETSTTLDLATKFSDVNIGNTKIIKLDTQYDDYKITSIENLGMTSSFSDIKISSLGNKFITNSKYGNVKIKDISANFEIIDIAARFVDVSVGIPLDASYQISSTTKFGDIHIPKSNSINKNETNMTTTTNGFIGSEKSSKSKIKINSEYGDITLTK